MSRPSDPSLRAAGLALVKSGLSIREAGRRVGVSHTVLAGWCREEGLRSKGTHPKPASAAQAERAEPAVESATTCRKPPPPVPDLPPAAQHWEARGVVWEGAGERQATRFLRGCALGMSLPDAAQYAGIPSRQLGEWLARAEEGTEPWASWLLLVGEAVGDGHEELLRIVRSGKPGWQSAGWLLERWRPASYGRRVEVVQERRQAFEEMPIDALLAAVDAWRGRVDKGPAGG